MRTALPGRHSLHLWPFTKPAGRKDIMNFLGAELKPTIIMDIIDGLSLMCSSCEQINPVGDLWDKFPLTRRRKELRTHCQWTHCCALSVGEDYECLFYAFPRTNMKKFKLHGRRQLSVHAWSGLGQTIGDPRGNKQFGSTGLDHLQNIFWWLQNRVQMYDRCGFQHASYPFTRAHAIISDQTYLMFILRKLQF